MTNSISSWLVVLASSASITGISFFGEINFDMLNIFFWFAQVFCIGYSLTFRLVHSAQHQIFFAPLAGLAFVLIFSSTIWFANIAPSTANYFLVSIFFFSLIDVWKNIPKDENSAGNLALLFCGCLIIAAHGSLIPFEEKLFQAYPLDRWGYLASSIYFSQEKLSFFTEAIEKMAYNGDLTAFLTHNLLPMTVGEIRARPAVEVAFGMLAWLTPKELYALANAWEVFLRVVQFSALLALISVFIKRKRTMFLIALAINLGYWSQYAKDFNSWPHLITLSFMLGTIAYLAILHSHLSAHPNSAAMIRRPFARNYIFYLLILAMVIAHGEFALVVGTGLAIAIFTVKRLRNDIVLQKYFPFEALGLFTLVFIAHPYLFEWVIRMYLQSPGMTGGIEYVAKGIYVLFGTDVEKNIFAKAILESPYALFSNPELIIGIFIGIFGFPYVEYFGASTCLSFVVGACSYIFLSSILNAKIKSRSTASSRTQFTSILYQLCIFCFSLLFGYLTYAAITLSISNQLITLANFQSLVIVVLVSFLVFCVTQTVREKHQYREYFITISMFFFFWTLMFLIFVALGHHGGAYRLLPYWGLLSSLSFIVLLLMSKRQYFRHLAVFFCCLNLYFGATIFNVTNNKGLESFANFYPNKDGFRHFEIEKARSKYDFDYRELIPELTNCKSVYLDLANEETLSLRHPRFFEVNLLMYLENQRIPAYRSQPSRNSGLLGDIFFAGYELENVKPDCIVTQEIKNERIAYKFIQAQPVNRRQ